jgi:hypothetical protein
MQRCGECDGAAQPGTAYLNGTPYCERHFKVVERRVAVVVALEPCSLTEADLDILAAAPPMLSAGMLFPPRRANGYRQSKAA